jgi:glycine hydroxymethyltransferase
MREREMKKIAEFIARVVVEKERPESLAPEVVAFRKKFAAIHYCFKPEDVIVDG